MTKATCSVPECEEEALSRGLCRRDYGRARRLGTLPPRQIPPGIHSVTNVNHDARMGDCTECGPQVKVRVRTRAKPNGSIYVAVTCWTVYKVGRDRREARTGSRRKALHRRKYARRNSTPEEYDRLYAAQQGKCAICLESKPVLGIDHDHTTGIVRGLLCGKCNSAIGFLRDSAELTARATEYLRASEASAA